jgi:hypothetical protein
VASLVVLQRWEGVDRAFEFRSMLVGTGHALYPRERLPKGQEGDEFSVLGPRLTNG